MAGASAFFGSSQPASIGVSSRARASETASVAIITSASGPKNWPVRSFKKVSGRNAAMVVSDEPIMAGVIAFSPAAMASERALPLSSSWNMFSTTTMPSSMTRPRAMASAPRVMMFIVCPSTFIRANVMMIVSGRMISTMAAVRRLPRKSISTNRASTPPTISDSMTLCWDPMTISDWS